MPRSKILNRTVGGVPTEVQIPVEELKRPKTRAPVSVRVRERREKENRSPDFAPQYHTSPALSARGGKDAVMPSMIAALMTALQSAIASRDWHRLDTLIASMREQNFRLDSPDMSEYREVKKVIDSAVFSLLDSDGDPDDEQLLMAVELLERGCDCDAVNQQGKTALEVICDRMSDDLREIVVVEYPQFKELFANHEQ